MVSVHVCIACTAGIPIRGKQKAVAGGGGREGGQLTTNGMPAIQANICVKGKFIIIYEGFALRKC